MPLRKSYRLWILIFALLLKHTTCTPFDEDDEDVINAFIDSATANETIGNTKVATEFIESDISLETLTQEILGGKLTSSNEDKDQSSPPLQACSCVKYYLCDVDNETTVSAPQVSGLGLIDIRLGNSGGKPGPCEHYFDICCKSQRPKKPVQPPAVSDERGCGKRNTRGVGFRITGALDNESQFGEFPWMAAIVRKEFKGKDKPPQNIYVCGGSLIHPRVVLTAAHCVFGKLSSELKVRLGEWDTQTAEELYPHQDRNVSKILIHDNFYAGALYNDIALLFLDSPVNIAPNVDTVCLPPANVNFDGQRCFASGWGRDSFADEGKYQVILKRVEVPVVPRPKCEAALRTTRLGPYFKLDGSFVCAGGEPGKDTCRDSESFSLQGDGGSPLVCQLPNSKAYAQFGIVAWGIGCGEKGIPGVYANVPKFVPWIESKLAAANIDTSSFKNVR